MRDMMMTALWHEHDGEMAVLFIPIQVKCYLKCCQKKSNCNSFWKYSQEPMYSNKTFLFCIFFYQQLLEEHVLKIK